MKNSIKKNFILITSFDKYLLIFQLNEILLGIFICYLFKILIKSRACHQFLNILFFISFLTLCLLIWQFLKIIFTPCIVLCTDMNLREEWRCVAVFNYLRLSCPSNIKIMSNVLKQISNTLSDSKGFIQRLFSTKILDRAGTKE